MIDHVTFAVGDLQRSIAFYRAALAPLGLRLLVEVPAGTGGKRAFVGIGDERPFFWLGEGEPLSGALHVAFSAATRGAVDAFHRAGLDAGGRDNGAPGLRPHYHRDYYGAFLRDPDGHNIEAVCRAPA